MDFKARVVYPLNMHVSPLNRKTMAPAGLKNVLEQVLSKGYLHELILSAQEADKPVNHGNAAPGWTFLTCRKLPRILFGKAAAVVPT